MKTSVPILSCMVVVFLLCSCQKPSTPGLPVSPPPVNPPAIPPVDPVQDDGKGDTTGLIKTIEYSRWPVYSGQYFSVREHYSYDSAKSEVHISVEQLLAINSNQFPTGTEIILSYEGSKKLSQVSYNWPAGYAIPANMPKKIKFTYDAQNILSNLAIDWEGGTSENYPYTKTIQDGNKYELTWKEPTPSANLPRIPVYSAIFDASGKCLAKKLTTRNTFAPYSAKIVIDSFGYDGNNKSIQTLRHIERDSSGFMFIDKMIMTANSRAKDGKQLANFVKRLFNGFVDLGANDTGTFYFGFAGVLTEALQGYEWFQINEFPITDAKVFFPGLNTYKFVVPALKFDDKGRLTSYPGFHYELDSPQTFYNISYYN